MDATAKEAILVKAIDEDNEEYDSELQAMQEAGIKLCSRDDDYDECEGRDDDSEQSEDDEVTDLTEDISHLREWDESGDRKRTAKEVAADEGETEQNREKAAEWLLKNKKNRANQGRAKKGKQRTGTRQRRETMTRGAHRKTR